MITHIILITLITLIILISLIILIILITHTGQRLNSKTKEWL